MAWSVYPFLDAAQRQTLMMDTFVPTTHWAYNNATTKYANDPVLGRQLLEQAGWTLQPGATYRTNGAGKELVLELTTTTAQFRQTWAAAMENQLRGCGIRLVRNHMSSSWFFGDDTGLARRDFEMAAFAWVGESDPKGRTLYACNQIPQPGNGWSGQNYMGWCNPTASSAIISATATLRRTERIGYYHTVQQEFATDMVSLPLFQRVEVAGAARNLVGMAPNTTEYFTWNSHKWALSGRDTIVVGLHAEPDTLFPPLAQSAASAMVRQLIYGAALTTLNYDCQTQLYKAVPTLENGGAVNNTVDVGAGTVVVDARGNVAPLVYGMVVVNANGQEVTYAGGTIQMKQLVITGSYLNDMQWPDGTSLVKADMALWDRINCDHSNGASEWVFYNCDRTKLREYLDDNTTARFTLLPGYQPQSYMTFLPGAYPSQRVLGDGRKLGDVPAAEWRNLPEVTTSPIGLGPYRLSEWVTGVKMMFEANPHFPLGAPKTPKIEVRFLPDSDQAVNDLIAGNLHVLDPWVLGAGATAQTLLDAARNGQAQAWVIPSPTWEHVDMNLELIWKTWLPVMCK